MPEPRNGASQTIISQHSSSDITRNTRNTKQRQNADGMRVESPLVQSSGHRGRKEGRRDAMREREARRSPLQDQRSGAIAGAFSIGSPLPSSLALISTVNDEQRTMGARRRSHVDMMDGQRHAARAPASTHRDTTGGFILRPPNEDARARLNGRAMETGVQAEGKLTRGIGRAYLVQEEDQRRLR